MKIRKYCFIGVLLTAFLQGCGTAGGKAPLSGAAANIGNFAADGKVALRYPRCDEYRGCKEEAFSAGLHWLHRSDADELSLYDPTGQEVLKLSYQGETVLLRDRQGERRIDRAQLAQELGVPIPVERLRDWLLLPRGEGRLEEAGWRVETEQWQGQYYRRLTLRQGDYYLRILLSNLVPF